MDTHKLFTEIKEQIVAVAERATPQGQQLWQALIAVHPADMADFFADLPRSDFLLLYTTLPDTLKTNVFNELPDSLKNILACQRDPPFRISPDGISKIAVWLLLHYILPLHRN